MAYVEELERENKRLRQELHEAMFVPATSWGNCKRGCPPAYLDDDGFCSPSCAKGGKRGQFYSLLELVYEPR